MCGENARYGLWRHALLVTALYFLVYVLIYGLVLVVPYGFFDDLLQTAFNLEGNLEPIFSQIVHGGRILYAIVTLFTFSHIGSVQQLMVLRLIGLVGYVLLSTSLYAFLRRSTLPIPVSFLLPVLMLSMPPFQVFAAWAITAFFPYAAVLTGISVWLIDRHYPTPMKRNFFMAVAILLECCALSIYQPIAMFFWVYAAIRLFCPVQFPAVAWRRFGKYAGVAVAALLVSYIVSVQWIPRILFGQLNTFERTRLVSSPLEKMVWFVKQPLVDSLNFTNIEPKLGLASLFALVIGIGLFLYFHEERVQDRFLHLLLAGILVPLSLLPNLVVEESWASYRIQVSLVSLLTLYGMLAMIGFSRMVRITLRERSVATLAALVTAFASLSAMRNVVVEFVLPQYIEYRFLIFQLGKGDLDHASTVYFVRANWTDSIAPVVRADEFGMPSSYPTWMPKPLVYLALHEVNPGKQGLPVIVAEEGTFNPPPHSIVVDMRKIRAFRIDADIW